MIERNCKPSKITNPRKSFLSYIELAYLLLGTFVKCYAFYLLTGLENYSFSISLATVCVLFMIYILFLFLTKKNPSTILIGIYFSLSILIFIDVLYFSYFSNLPGVRKLTLLKYLVGVTDSVGALFNYKQLFYLVDLPLIVIYLIFLRRRIAEMAKISKERIFKLAKCLLSALCSVFIMITSVSIAAQGGYYQALQNELLYYHTQDVFSLLLPNTDDNATDLVQYLKDDNDEASELKYHGLAKGRNLINIQVEALQDFVIGAYYNGQELTPNLNALIKENSLYFDNYYWVVGGGGTSDAEFAVNNSLYAPDQEAAYDKFTELDYYGLPFLLKDNGYSGAYVFHGYIESFWNRDKAYPYQGYDEYIGKSHFEEKDIIGMGISDREFFKQSMSYLTSYQEPFYAFMITLSSHHPFTMPNEYRLLTLEEKHEETLFGDYLQSVYYVDMVLGEFIEDLKKSGLYDRSVITIYGDHYALNTQNDDGFMSEFLGVPYNREEIFNIPLIVHIPGSGVTETIHTTGGHLDYEPTILNLLGISNNKAVMFGQDLINHNKGVIYMQNHMSIGSFIDDSVVAVNTGTGLKVYDKFTMRELNASLYQEKSDLAKKTIADSQYILNNNLIRVNNWS
ncbi:MAG: LTA synthase family protein [Clostridiales bacterium]|nr:LTA synthase family protein [Clostridiales bacterium]